MGLMITLLILSFIFAMINFMLPEATVFLIREIKTWN